MPNQSNTQTKVSSPPGMPRAAWILLGVWLLYSAGALGWHLAHDPLLSTYICRTR